MSELMDVYEPGDKFLTVSTTGNARMWRVTANGDIVPDVHPHGGLTASYPIAGSSITPMP